MQQCKIDQRSSTEHSLVAWKSPSLQFGADPRVAIVRWKAGFLNLLHGNTLKTLGMSIPDIIPNRTDRNAVLFELLLVFK